MSEVLRTDKLQGKIIHQFGDIEEADNDLPNWWLAILYLSTLFAVGYWFYYHVFEVGPGTYASYHAAMAESEARVKASPQLGETELMALSKDPTALKNGSALYATHCVACHGPQGEGVIGPNLTDNAWIHGGDAVSIHRSIAAGVANKGMPPWIASVGAKGVADVTAKVLSIRDTNVSGKPPEGKPRQ